MNENPILWAASLGILSRRATDTGIPAGDYTGGRASALPRFLKGGKGYALELERLD